LNEDKYEFLLPGKKKRDKETSSCA